MISCISLYSLCYYAHYELQGDSYVVDLIGDSAVCRVLLCCHAISTLESLYESFDNIFAKIICHATFRTIKPHDSIISINQLISLLYNSIICSRVFWDLNLWYELNDQNAVQYIHFGIFGNNFITLTVFIKL